MRTCSSAKLALASLGLLTALGSDPARGSELYLSGDLGISWTEGEGVGTNDVVGVSNEGTGEDATPVYGGALGAIFPMNSVLPWKWRMPGFREEASFPEWPVRFEVEHLRGRDAELATPSFNPFDSYRVDVNAWTLMGKVRVDLPISTPIEAVYGRVPFLEPFSLYTGAGAGMSQTEIRVNTGVLTGSKDHGQMAWQALAGFGYELSEHMTLSVGWRYVDFGQTKFRLFDASGTDRGRYKMDLSAHEFTTSLTVWFWRLPPLLGEDE